MKRLELSRDKGAPPLYIQLENILKRQIEDGEYVRGDILPSEKELQAMYGISRVTVRQAVSDLVKEGYLNSARGVGTAVVFEKIDEKVRRVISFSKEMELHGIRMETAYCRIFLEKSGRHVASRLNIPVGREVYRLVRVRHGKGVPLVYSVTYLNRICELPLDEKMYHDSLYDLLETQYNVRIARGQDTFEAVLADGVISRFLEIPVGAAAFKRSRVTFDQNDRVVEYTVCYYPGDKYKYTVDL